MTEFTEGQEVEVLVNPTCSPFREEKDTAWHKAKILQAQRCSADPDSYRYGKRWMVEFSDDTRAVFDVEHIRDPRRQMPNEPWRHALHRALMSIED